MASMIPRLTMNQHRNRDLAALRLFSSYRWRRRRSNISPTLPLSAGLLSRCSRSSTSRRVPRATIPPDKLGCDPNEVRVAVFLGPGIKRIIEEQLCPSDVVIPTELDRLPHDCSNGALVFVRQSIQQTGWNRDEDYPFASTWPAVLSHYERLVFPTEAVSVWWLISRATQSPGQLTSQPMRRS